MRKKALGEIRKHRIRDLLNIPREVTNKYIKKNKKGYRSKILWKFKK